MMVKRPFFWIIVATVAVFAAAPSFGGIGLRESLFLAAIYMILALNLNFMIGYTGYVNFGSIVFLASAAPWASSPSPSGAGPCGPPCSAQRS